MLQIWNLWGGLIYLIAPQKSKVAGVEVTVQTAVKAPHYKSGKLICHFLNSGIEDYY